MKQRIIFCLVCFLFSMTTLFSQHYQVGAGFTAGLPNDNANLSGGFNLFIEYKTDSPLSFRTAGGFAVTKFKDANLYLSELTYSLYWLEGSLIYMPIQSEYEPYIGGGIGYYFIATDDFKEIKTTTGNYTPIELSNKFSYHAKAGFAIPLSKSIKLFSKAKYVFLDKKLIVHAEEFGVDKVLRNHTFEEDLDLSSLFITVGLILKI
jgi:opacity protein-like surface antigen